ncbi:RNA-binding cell elongation regulator Jag/EloR [Halalkalibacter urbisdiaboli]|uniref:RNA-binding cell elongation regulator Jag/EloR n=1 Tax=Halalkalibacter urbisdiaboli TaxID=1960589 RepID=UPI000B4381F4|nr:RNA-binding cell elongation regulator Jag/EloR [Halalkalibacter urbisdiaboli]
MSQLTVSGKTIEEAVEKAILELGTTKERLSYRVLEEPQKGFLGFLGSKPAKIEAYVKPDPVEEALYFLEETLEKMNIKANVSKSLKGDINKFEITGPEDVGRVIGKRGQTLDALEYLTNLVANRQKESYLRIELDAENYREKRRQVLIQLANRVANKVRSSNEETKLEPMNAAERKIIHAALQKERGVQTYSQGQGANRHIIIAPK